MKKNINITIDNNKHRSGFSHHDARLSGLNENQYRNFLKAAADKSERGLVLLYWFCAHTGRGIGIDAEAMKEISTALANHILGEINPFALPWITEEQPLSGEIKRRRAETFIHAVMKKMREEGITEASATKQLYQQYGYPSFKTAESALNSFKRNNRNQFVEMTDECRGAKKIFKKLQERDKKLSPQEIAQKFSQKYKTDNEIKARTKKIEEQLIKDKSRSERAKKPRK